MRAMDEVQQGLAILSKYEDSVFYLDGDTIFAGPANRDVTTEDFNELLVLKWDNDDAGVFRFSLPIIR